MSTERPLIEIMLERTALMGKHRAIVKDIEDPKEERRVRVLCPSVMEKVLLNWALPEDAYKTDWLPKVGDLIWIEFEMGYHVGFPIWCGLILAKEDITQEFLDNYGFDYRIDKDYNENKIEWTKTGFIITDKNNNIIETKESGIKITDKNGNTIETVFDRVKINGTNFEVLK